MEISPALQFRMLAAALAAGLAAGALFDVFAALRIFFGVHTPPARLRPLYEKPLPLLGRPVPIRGKNRSRRFWRHAVIGAFDLLFCVIFAVATELILYEYNNGAFRASVPLAALTGLALWRLTVSRVGDLLTGLVAFGLAAGLCYLRALLVYPLRRAARLFLHFVWGPARRACVSLQAARQARMTERLCRAQLKQAARAAWPTPPERK